MFLDNLSAAVLRLCDKNGLTYEAASERCNLSARYFADIARGKTAPTVLTLEKLCTGFHRTPNDLLIPGTVLQEITFRQPLPVTQIRFRGSCCGLVSFPVCPRCCVALEREYQEYCDRCGQHLDWTFFPEMTPSFI